MKPSKMASKPLMKGPIQKRIDASDSSDYVSFPHSNHKTSSNLGGGNGTGNENDISISSYEGPPFMAINNNQRKRGQSSKVLNKNPLAGGGGGGSSLSNEQYIMMQPHSRQYTMKNAAMMLKEG
jgi:hypothetical protein